MAQSHKLVAAVADTHLPRGSRRLPERCVELLRSADLILHAGDVSGLSAFDDLCGLGPPVHHSSVLSTSATVVASGAGAAGFC